MDTVMNFKLMDGSTLTGSPCEKVRELTWPSKDIRQAEEELFVENAHFLLENAQRIFLDSRLFLAPVRIMSGLAYTGPLPMPCLGGYLEWWINAKCASNVTENGRELVFSISGSPLSGRNVSEAVRRDGTRCQAGGNLLTLAKSYCDLMLRYREQMRNLESYTLEESINLLKGRENTFENSLRKIVLEQKVLTVSNENTALKSSVARQAALIKAYQKALCRAVVREFPEDVRSAINQANAETMVGSRLAQKGSANWPITMLFQAFAKREGIVLSAPSKRVLLDELTKQQQ